MKKARVLAGLIEKQGTSRRAFAERIGMPATTLQSMLTRGVGNASVNNVIKVCRGLGITTEDLERISKGETQTIPNAIPFKTKKVPLLGTIAAGEPIFADQHYDAYIEIDEDIKVDFCLRVKGDSMVDARINDGDLVFIHRQPEVENGEIAAVLIDDEVTLKYFYRNDSGVIIKPGNSKYQPRFYTAEDFKDVRVLGKAVFFQSKL